ncbi:hypothetical protein [Cryptosporangium minutisporangium]|uniref:Uncharacterized protein n=1 Tax=Cryptosporangium minutisporangium TaxID=113569 RepID=A0ABP6T6X4_9ACTN
MAYRGGYRSSASRAVTGITAALVVVIVLGIVFVLLNADQANMVVNFVLAVGRWLTRPFANLFQMETVDQAVLVNWGMAAVAYFFIGSALARLTRG